MKTLLCTVLLGLGILGLCSCAEQSEQENSTSETTAAVTTVTTAITTVTTTVTTAPPPEFRLEKEMRFRIDADSVRPWGCTAELENPGEEKREYTNHFRVLNAESGFEYLVCSGFEEKDVKAYGIRPEENAELKLSWGDRYGDLPSGKYILEVVLEEPEDEDPLVCRTEFSVTAEGYVPVLYIAPENVKTTGVTLTIDNQTDTGRSYAYVYRLYDESTEPRAELLRIFDQAVRLNDTNYVAPGETLDLNFSWAENYGALPAGHYRIEIEMLADGDSEGKTYSAEFDIQ